MNTLSVFDMFFRRQPFNGGFSVFAGLGPLLETIENFHFTKEDIEYLDSLSLFEKGFLDYLASLPFFRRNMGNGRRLDRIFRTSPFSASTPTSSKRRSSKDLS